MRVYLDMCCYNRPYDDQSQLRVAMEAQSKLHIQNLITEGFVKQENLITLFSEIRKLGKSCLIDSNGLRPIPGRWKSQRA